MHSLPRLFVISALAPGVGHFLVGKRRVGAALLAGVLVAGLAAPVAGFFGHAHLAWLLVRAAMLTALFATVDATLLGAEKNDDRQWNGFDRPRLVSYLDLVTYGLGTWRRGERFLAFLAGFAGLFLHGFVAARNLPLLLMAEALMLAWGWFSWQRAREQAVLSRFSVTTDFDALGEEDDAPDFAHQEDDLAPRRRTRRPKAAPRPVDRTPSWLQPALAGFCLFIFVTTLVGQTVVQNVSEALRIERDRAVAMEPFYRNPDYGIALEMNAPGWNFVDPADNEFVVARHISRDATLRLAVQPRLPLLNSDRAAVVTAVAEAAMDGLLLQVVDEGPAEIGGRSGHFLRARGQRGAKPVIVDLWATGKGWREYVLWFERSPQNENFARVESKFLLDHLSIENGRPDLLEPSTAR